MTKLFYWSLIPRDVVLMIGRYLFGGSASWLEIRNLLTGPLILPAENRPTDTYQVVSSGKIKNVISFIQTALGDPTGNFLTLLSWDYGKEPSFGNDWVETPYLRIVPMQFWLALAMGLPSTYCRFKRELAAWVAEEPDTRTPDAQQLSNLINGCGSEKLITHLINQGELRLTSELCVRRSSISLYQQYLAQGGSPLRLLNMGYRYGPKARNFYLYWLSTTDRVIFWNTFHEGTQRNLLADFLRLKVTVDLSSGPPERRFSEHWIDLVEIDAGKQSNSLLEFFDQLPLNDRPWILFRMVNQVFRRRDDTPYDFSLWRPYYERLLAQNQIHSGFYAHLSQLPLWIFDELWPLLNASRIRRTRWLRAQGL